MDENRIPRDSAKLLEFREKRRIPQFSRISRNRGKPTAVLMSHALTRVMGHKM